MDTERKIDDLEEEIKNVKARNIVLVDKLVEEKNRASECVDKMSNSLFESLEEVKFLRSILKKIVEI